MYELTNETVAGRKYYAKLELDDGTVLTNYGDDAVGITSISLSQTLCGSESVSIGCVNAASATIVLEAGTALENQRFTLYLGQAFDGAVEWVPMGIFTGTKAEVSEDKLTVEAWDDLYFAGGTYTPDSSVTGTCAFYEALADVCDKLEWGFHENAAAQTVNGIDVSGLTIAGMPTGLTYAAAIGYLAALLGANACMDREGCLALRQFTETGQGLGTDDCYSGGMVFKTSDFTVASLINTLEAETTDDNGETTTETAEVERTTGAAGGSIALTNPLMTEDNIDTAWDVVKGFTYRPATLTAVGQLAVDVGDVLRVCTLTGGRNYLIQSTMTDGYRLNNTGGKYLSTYSSVTDFIAVPAADKMTYSVHTPYTNEGDCYFQLVFYDRDETFLSRVLQQVATTTENLTKWTVDVPSGAAYFRAALPTSIKNMVKLEIGSEATSWTPALEDEDENIYDVPVMTHTLEYDGGLKSTITAAGESESQQSAAVSGPVAQQIKELTTKVADTKVLALGKAAVYYAAVAPSADDYTLSVNDLWFDTSGGDYAMYYWDGSKWVAAPFGTSALGDDIITAAKIVAGAVTAEKLNVSELSAIAANLGTITGGSININDLFSVDSDGNLTAVSGIIGGLTIARTFLLLENVQEGYTGDASGALIDEGSAIVSALGVNDEVVEGTYNIINSNNSSSDSAFLAVGVPISNNTYFLYKAAAYILHDGRAKFASVAANSAYLGDTTVDGTLDVTGETTVNGFRVPEIQHGYVYVTPSAAGETTSAEVTFDKTFSGTPTVTATVQTTVPNSRAAGVMDVSTTGFTVYVYSSGSARVRVYWIAVY